MSAEFAQPAAPTVAEPDLDFIVIGVQKGGTTSLWRYLRGHPGIAMPDYKEWPVFCSGPERLPGRLEWFVKTNFDGLSPEVRRGHLSTHYMMGMGSADADVETIAERIARTLPDVRLIALLRDPIDRAMSQYRMSVRRGLERRSFDTAVEELLEPEQLEAGRARSSETNSYLAQGEYGRILQIYRARFAPERILVESTADLGRDPGLVLDRVLDFLGLPTGYRPEGLGVRHHRGGTRPRIDAEAEAELRAFMEYDVLLRLGHEAEALRHTFDFFLRTWNVIPDNLQPALSESNRRRLETHYRADAELLAALGVMAPWLDG